MITTQINPIESSSTLIRNTKRIKNSSTYSTLVYFYFFLILLAQSSDISLSFHTDKNNNNKKCDIIPEEDEELLKPDTKLVNKRFFNKVSINKNVNKHFTKPNTRASSTLIGSNNKINDFFFSRNNEISTPKTKEKLSFIKPILVSSKEVPVLVFKNDKICTNETPSILPLTTKLSLQQEKERREIKDLFKIKQGGIVPSINDIKRERNINSASTCEFTCDTNTKKFAFEGKTLDELNNERMHLVSAHSNCSLMSKGNALLNIPLKRPMSNFNGLGVNLWETIQEEGSIQQLEKNKSTTKKTNENKISNSSGKTKTSRRNYSQNCQRKDLLGENEFQLPNSGGNNHCLLNKFNSVNLENKRLHKIKIEKGMLSSKFVNTLINKFHFNFDTQSFGNNNNNINNNINPLASSLAF